MYSYDPEVIVKQLVTILDEIDSYEKSFQLDYYVGINTYCHMALIQKSNTILLPFLNIIERYNDSTTEHKVQLLQSCYNKCQSQSIRRNSFKKLSTDF
jgi:hypothetical protein